MIVIHGYSADSSGRSNRHTARCGATAWLAPDWIGGWPWLRPERRPSHLSDPSA
ncbi:MAG: hypothetical protein HY259_00660 [Chloroflexi bacterium]|nr:hypothetical protein [Chloroflexota bacterium]